MIRASCAKVLAMLYLSLSLGADAGQATGDYASHRLRSDRLVYVELSGAPAGRPACAAPPTLSAFSALCALGGIGADYASKLVPIYTGVTSRQFEVEMCAPFVKTELTD